jgi:hypothetical protein
VTPPGRSSARLTCPPAASGSTPTTQLVQRWVKRRRGRPNYQLAGLARRLRVIE